MKTINLIHVIAWLALGLACLGGAVFARAHWHYGTAAMCFIMAWQFYREYKS